MPLPLIPRASALIPLVADLAPSVVRFLVGDKAANTTEKVAEATKQVNEAATKVAETVKAVTNTDVSTPEGVAKVRKQLAENPELKSKLQVELLRIDLEFERIELEREQAYLKDTQGARIMAVERLKAGGDDTRANTMLALAFGAIVAIVALLTLANEEVAGEVQGFVIGIGGMFARNIGSAFDFEFGSSKGSKIKAVQMESQLAELQQATRERIADKQREVEGIADLARQQAAVAQTVGKIGQAASTVKRLRDTLKSS